MSGNLSMFQQLYKPQATKNVVTPSGELFKIE